MQDNRSGDQCTDRVAQLNLPGYVQGNGVCVEQALRRLSDFVACFETRYIDCYVLYNTRRRVALQRKWDADGAMQPGPYRVRGTPCRRHRGRCNRGATGGAGALSHARRAQRARQARPTSV